MHLIIFYVNITGFVPARFGQDEAEDVQGYSRL